MQAECCKRLTLPPPHTHVLTLVKRTAPIVAVVIVPSKQLQPSAATGSSPQTSPQQNKLGVDGRQNMRKAAGAAAAAARAPGGQEEVPASARVAGVSESGFDLATVGGVLARICNAAPAFVISLAGPEGARSLQLQAVGVIYTHWQAAAQGQGV